MAPTAQQLSSEWMTEAEKETEKDRLIRKSKQSPFIPIGELNSSSLRAYFQNVCPLDSRDRTVHEFMRKDHKYFWNTERLNTSLKEESI